MVLDDRDFMSMAVKQAQKSLSEGGIPIGRGIRVMFIQPGKPTPNAYVERFNRTVRHEWLDLHLFDSIEHAQATATQWLWQYNNERPNTAIGGITPKQKLAKAA